MDLFKCPGPLLSSKHSDKQRLQCYPKSSFSIAIFIVFVSLAVCSLQAQNCGQQTITCSSGGPQCENGAWTCPCGTPCTIPPSQYVCNEGEYGTPTCGTNGWYCNQNGSPIIIDTTGKGFALTSASAGVLFDISGTGYPVQIAWTAPGSGTAFLALDRNGNGKIDSGKELFGNYTQQPKSNQPNGYLALAEFDKPENGGNGDGIIDQHDSIFPSLLLWIDENHDGISQPSELYPPPELGVYSISLHYRDDEHFFDQYGNWFHYQATLNPNPQDGTSKDGRLTYDVFFVTDHSYGRSVRPPSSPGYFLPPETLFSPVRSGRPVAIARVR